MRTEIKETSTLLYTVEKFKRFFKRVYRDWYVVVTGRTILARFSVRFVSLVLETRSEMSPKCFNRSDLVLVDCHNNYIAKNPRKAEDISVLVNLFTGLIFFPPRNSHNIQLSFYCKYCTKSQRRRTFALIALLTALEHFISR
jgi:hypothetical protein